MPYSVRRVGARGRRLQVLERASVARSACEGPSGFPLSLSLMISPHRPSSLSPHGYPTPAGVFAVGASSPRCPLPGLSSLTRRLEKKRWRRAFPLPLLSLLLRGARVVPVLVPRHAHGTSCRRRVPTFPRCHAWLYRKEGPTDWREEQDLGGKRFSFPLSQLTWRVLQRIIGRCDQVGGEGFFTRGVAQGGLAKSENAVTRGNALRRG